jgi:hypothetical protein
MRGERIEYWVGEFCDAVGKSAKHSCQSHVIYEIDCLIKEVEKENKYKTLWDNLKDRLHLGIENAKEDEDGWDTSIAEQILKEMTEEEARK